MSLQKYASPLQINLTPSRLLLALMLFLHLGALSLLCMSSLPWYMALLLALLIVLNLLFVAQRTGWLSAAAMPFNLTPGFISACWGDNDGWLLRDAEGKEYAAELLPTSYVNRLLVVVNLRLAELPWYRRQVSLVFLPDNIEAETFRRLRIRLRWYSPLHQESSVVPK